MRERVSFEGEVLEPLDGEELALVLERIAEDGYEAVAVALLARLCQPGA